MEALTEGRELHLVVCKQTPEVASRDERCTVAARQQALVLLEFDISHQICAVLTAGLPTNCPAPAWVAPVTSIIKLAYKIHISALYEKKDMPPFSIRSASYTHTTYRQAFKFASADVVHPLKHVGLPAQEGPERVEQRQRNQERLRLAKIPQQAEGKRGNGARNERAHLRPTAHVRQSEAEGKTLGAPSPVATGQGPH
eukprot:363116-Chlamydomonas_euryale.AAC.1